MQLILKLYPIVLFIVTGQIQIKNEWVITV